MEALDEQARHASGNLSRDFDNPFAGKILGFWEIGGIVVEGLVEAGKDGLKWLGDKALSVMEAPDNNLADFPTDD